MMMRQLPPGSLDPRSGRIHLAHAHAATQRTTPRRVPARKEAGGRRSWRHPPRCHPNFRTAPRRRTFTARDKLRILTDADRAAETGGDRCDPAPRGPLLVDFVRLAPSARRRHPRRADAGQARPENRPTNPLAAENGLCKRITPSSRAASLAPRPSLRSKKNLPTCWGSRWRRTATCHDRSRRWRCRRSAA